MNWKYFWNLNAKNPNLKIQVGRIVNGKELSDEIVEKTANYISVQLGLTPSSEILDICCGNGMITNLIAKNCKHIVGIDFSENLIEIAKQKPLSNTTFICANALDFKLNKEFDAIYIAFSFQYFEKTKDAAQLIKNCIAHLKNKGKLLITDIPDTTKKHNFYNTLPKKITLFIQNMAGKNNMGRFWEKSEIKKLCNDLQVSCTIIPQQGWQPYHYYRFDVLITK